MEYKEAFDIWQLIRNNPDELTKICSRDPDIIIEFYLTVNRALRTCQRNVDRRYKRKYGGGTK